ncbi:Crp/Fnr family transcriptional regulator [Pelagibacterium xiamenense]|uniref:Crp/Fnr family transcriptional regulator n=1 Tax=Pelagibacterium xiamenense TaxID=2901140 RepID=UPI001E2B397D|nr:Crp/Fnr family transcriptional regulator [Pelagibacterium xiamenense]MCD7059688.1 Crp/Fnr family transcriptional regulator [Pelagibacterium xiamenense]
MIEITMLPEPFDTIPSADRFMRTYEKGETVFLTGQDIAGLGIVIEGSLELAFTGVGGERVIIHRAETGDTLVEPCLFAPSYQCDCTALTAARIVFLRKQAVIDLLASRPDFALSYIKTLAAQVDALRARLELRNIKSARDRVLAALMLIGQTRTVSAFASEIGLTHEATFRALSALVAEGRAVRLERGRYAPAG